MRKAKSSDPRGGHARLYWHLLDSHAYIACSNSAKALYVDLRRKLGANNNGNIECTLGTLKRRGWRSPATLFTALHELVAVGLLVQTRKGGIASMSKICSLYRFTDVEVYEQPKLCIAACRATHDYLRFENLGRARDAIKDLRQRKQERAKWNKKAKLQKLNLVDSKTVAMSRS